MEQNSSGEPDAFRRFIEDALDLGSLPDNPERLARLAAQYGYVHRSEEYRPQLRQDILDVLSKLQQEPAQLTQYLTPLERETQAVLAGLIGDVMQKRLPTSPTAENLREMASYTLMVGWLVLASLLEKYTPPEPDDENEE